MSTSSKTVTIVDCTFSNQFNCSSTLLCGSDLEIFNSSFINNHCETSGAINFQCISTAFQCLKYKTVSPSNVEINNVSFIENSASECGGVIALSRSILTSISISVSNCYFSSNYAPYGGVFCLDLKSWMSSFYLQLHYSQFFNNSAILGGNKN